MHPIHHSEAFVLKSIERGEANKRVWLFTREYGLIIATVQGVRKSGAKLRSHITDYCYIGADLVKGRDVWRLTSAQIQKNPFAGDYDKLRARSYIRALSLVERFCIEEGPEPKLFEHLVSTMNVVSEPSINAPFFDTIVLWKILVLLGYLELTPDLNELFDVNLLEIVDLPESVAKRLIKDVTDAINRTHL
ncbi:MAG: DNA repair protein RecO [Patescibacteria group bacterium]